MSVGNVRKCAECKDIIYFNRYDGSFVQFKNLYYHTSCLKQKLLNGKTVRTRKTQAELNQLIPELQAATSAQIQSIQAKSTLISLIANHYDLAVFPPMLHLRLADVFNGKYKGLTRPLLPDHLLDMWMQKFDWLDEQVAKYRSGNPPTGVGRVLYDLAVLVNKYNDYLAWLETSKQEKNETAAQVKENKEGQINLSRVPQAKKPVYSGKVDLEAMADDIWGA